MVPMPAPTSTAAAHSTGAESTGRISTRSATHEAKMLGSTSHGRAAPTAKDRGPSLAQKTVPASASLAYV